MYDLTAPALQHPQIAADETTVAILPLQFRHGRTYGGAMQRSDDAKMVNGMSDIEQRRARVLVETVRHRIEGFLTLPLGGYRSRVSDYLNAADRGQFLSLADATLEPLDGGESEQHGFLAVSRNQIVFVLELDSVDAQQQAPLGESSLASA